MRRQAMPAAEYRRRQLLKGIAGGIIGAPIAYLLIWAAWILLEAAR